MRFGEACRIFDNTTAALGAAKERCEELSSRKVEIKNVLERDDRVLKGLLVLC